MDMRRGSTGLLILFGLSLAACDKSPSSVPPDAQQTANALTGDNKGEASANPLCRMFTTAEIEGYGGAPVGAGTNAAMGTGCQWPGAQGDGKGSVMLQIVAASDHEPPSAAAGFKKLADIGTEGFVVPEMGGWHAGAIQGKKSINVMTSGPAASEEKTVAFLREAIKRAGS
jgi:hypothetical protein